MPEGREASPQDDHKEGKYRIDPRTGTVEAVPDSVEKQIKQAEKIQETREDNG